MKLHRHLAAGALDILQEIFQGTYADKAIEKSFKAHKQWGSRDRHFVAETVYECVRWWTKLWYGLGVAEEECLQSSYFKADSEKAWHMLAAYFEMQGIEKQDWPEFKAARSVKNRILALKNTDAAYHAVPTWLFEKGLEELGPSWLTTLEGLNQKADVILRANLLKTTAQKLQSILLTEDIQTDLLPDYPDALRLQKRANVFRLRAFQEGLFEVQDAASQKVAPFLDPRPGERIVDACAGAGGKSLHLATLMKNKGKVLSLDIHDWKLSELKTRASRNSIDIIETRAIESTKTIKRLHEGAQGVLLDVPCSGLGALRRNPDSKWKLKPESFEELYKTQSKILMDYCKMVSPRGRLVYATCSVLPSENQNQVQKFLEQNSEFELLKEHWENPSIQGFDGFYMALMRRK